MIINMNGAKAPETPSPVLQEKTVTPETLPTVIGADEGYDGLSQVTVNPDSQLKAENIRSGKTIFGVQGAFVGEPVYADSIDPATITGSMSNSLAYSIGFIGTFSAKGGVEPFEGSSRKYVLDAEYVLIGTQNGAIAAYKKLAGSGVPHIGTTSYIPSYDWHHDTQTYDGNYECFLTSDAASLVGDVVDGHIKGSAWLCPTMLYYKYSSDNINPNGVLAVSETAIITGEIIPIDVDTTFTVDSTGKHFTVSLSAAEVDVYGSFPSYISYSKVSAGFVFVPNKIVIS